ncbi:hypothetical protein F2Q70_00044297 [Brassica cretica]|uniref:Uncharacterized protein n=1 Tax=Brassica cretica TaxID=69181 RepID=A0A8S9KMN6_BRACR|nr:hypothetical protein F2Q70_00044297 [Brassica cretica]
MLLCCELSMDQVVVTGSVSSVMLHPVKGPSGINVAMAMISLGMRDHASVSANWDGTLHRESLFRWPGDLHGAEPRQKPICSIHPVDDDIYSLSHS